jgi:hypothetical protein
VLRLSRSTGWLALALCAALISLYGTALRVGFLNDDYLLLEASRGRPLVATLGALGPLGNFFRPVSRQLYFGALASLFGDRPLAFHLANFALFLVSLALLADLLRAWLPRPGVLAGLLYFAVLPLQRVNLTWISCSQDLLALAFALGSVALFRRGRPGWAALAYLIACFCKESALPLPLALLALRRLEPAPEPGAERPRPARWLPPFAAAAGAWLLANLWVRLRVPAPPLDFSPVDFAAAYVHGIQSLLGLDDPQSFPAGLAHPGVPQLALLFLAPMAVALRGAVTEAPRPARAALTFGAAWLLAFALPIGPVAPRWSGYYYTLFAVGGALLVGIACARLRAVGWLVLATALLWWHAGATSARAFAVVERPWGWTSRVTPFYLQRAAALTDTLSRQMCALDPRPERGTRFFFSDLPPWAGFQMGNGALIRTLYRDPSLESYFYTQFSESTADDRLCRFLAWDGRSLGPLYPKTQDLYFQVGSDLLIYDRLPGARHAFRRALETGENRADPLYWLGWTELWMMRRGAAEAAWTAFGAKDDSAAWFWQMRVARQALNDQRDTLAARRALLAAIKSGIGRPEAHAVLGELLMRDRPKYGLLELKVATFLNPADWVARRELGLGLAAQRLDDLARDELAHVARLEPHPDDDTLRVGTMRRLDRESGPSSGVARF